MEQVDFDGIQQGRRFSGILFHVKHSGITVPETGVEVRMGSRKSTSYNYLISVFASLSMQPAHFISSSFCASSRFTSVMVLPFTNFMETTFFVAILCRADWGRGVFLSVK